jgi:hypothetical protein
LSDSLLEGSIEIFIHYESVCIFYYNFANPMKVPAVDIQLISGFLTANSLFFEEMRIGGDSRHFVIQRGDAELRMWVGNQVHATLILTNLEGLDLKAYYELDVLTNNIIQHFESEYLAEIEKFVFTGSYTFEGIDLFIEKEVSWMRAHMYSSYLMKILGEAINYNVRKAEAMELLIALNRAFNDSKHTYEDMLVHCDIVRSTINNYQNVHPSIAAIVQRVNRDDGQIWRLFKIDTLPIV